MVSAMHDTN